MIAELNDFEHWKDRMDAEEVFGEEIIPTVWHSAKRIEAFHQRPVKGKGSEIQNSSSLDKGT